MSAGTNGAAAAVEPAAKVATTPRAIQRAVAEHYGMPLAVLLGSRVPAVFNARACAYTLCRDLLGLSYPAIGKVFGRDHSGVLTAIERARAKPDVVLAAQVVTLKLTHQQPHCPLCGQKLDKAAAVDELRKEQARISARISALEEAG